VVVLGLCLVLLFAILACLRYFDGPAAASDPKEPTAVQGAAKKNN
jgi:hypothetical protein